MNEIDFPKFFDDCPYFEKPQNYKTDNQTPSPYSSPTDINCDKKPCKDCPLWCDKRECPPDLV